MAAPAAGIPARTRGNPRVGCPGHCRGVLHRSIAGAGHASGAGQPPGAGGRGRADAHAEAGPRCRARGRQPGPPESGAVQPARPEPRGANAALVGPDGAKSAPPGSAPAPPEQRPAPDQPADARRSTRSRAVPAASARTSVASAGLPSDAPFGPGSVRARSDGSSPEPAYVVKGKIATKVFYTPAGAYYTRTRADVWFRTADDARAAGFTERAPRRDR